MLLVNTNKLQNNSHHHVVQHQIQQNTEIIDKYIETTGAFLKFEFLCYKYHNVEELEHSNH